MPSTKASRATARRSRSSRSTRRRRVVYLTANDLAYVVHRIAEVSFTPEAYGEPMPPFELLPGGDRLLDSALAVPRWRYFRTIHEKGAALFRSLVKNHALKDGNKRLGVTALDVFLMINRVDLKASQRELVQIALAVAAFEGNFPLDAIVKFVRSSCTGRPRRIVGTLAEEWPAIREAIAYAVRTVDRAEGRGARVRRLRVRTPKAAALRQASEIMAERIVAEHREGSPLD